jgi:hypothetical protein
MKMRGISLVEEKEKWCILGGIGCEALKMIRGEIGRVAVILSCGGISRSGIHQDLTFFL